MSPGAKESSGLFLLPGYDEFLIGYKDRSPSFETYGDTPISTTTACSMPQLWKMARYLVFGNG